MLLAASLVLLGCWRCLDCFRGRLIFCLVLVVLVGGVLFCGLFGSFFVFFFLVRPFCSCLGVFCGVVRWL